MEVLDYEISMKQIDESVFDLYKNTSKNSELLLNKLLECDSDYKLFKQMYKDAKYRLE